MPSEAGARAEAAVAAAFVLAGKSVYLPLFAAHARVDLVFADDSGFHTVQVKTARLNGDVLTFWTCSNTAGRRKDYRDDVEFFAAFAPALAKVYLVPVELATTRLCTLRLQATRNGQHKGVRWADDFFLAETPRLTP